MESDIQEIKVLRAQLKDLEKENKYLKTLLRDAGIDYVSAGQIATLDAKTVFTPDQGSRIIPVEITRNHARLFFTYF